MKSKGVICGATAEEEGECLFAWESDRMKWNEMESNGIQTEGGEQTHDLTPIYHLGHHEEDEPVDQVPGDGGDSDGGGDGDSDGDGDWRLVVIGGGWWRPTYSALHWLAAISGRR